MADTKISALPAATALDGTETYPAVQSGSDVKATGTQIKAMVQSGINNQSASYTAVLTDANNLVRFTGASAQTFTVPPNSSVAFAVGAELTVSQAGAGSVAIAAGAGVTINSRGSLVNVAGQYGVAMLKQVAANTWLLTGDLA